MTLLPAHPITWTGSVAQLLEEHHLVVLSDEPAARTRFLRMLRSHLAPLAHTDIVVIDGRRALDLPRFARCLGDRRPERARERSGMEGVARRLRGNPTRARRRFILWNDADEMLEHDVNLFSRLVNVLMAVAADLEHVSTGPLLIQRVVFAGGAKLGAYAEDEGAQFQRWLDDDEGAALFWEVLSCVERPPVLTYRLEG